MTQDTSQQSSSDGGTIDKLNASKHNPFLKVLGSLLLVLALGCLCASCYWSYRTIAARSEIKKLKEEFDSKMLKLESSDLNAGLGLGFLGIPRGSNAIKGSIENMARIADLTGQVGIQVGEKRVYQFLSLTMLFGFPGYGLWKQ